MHELFNAEPTAMVGCDMWWIHNKPFVRSNWVSTTEPIRVNLLNVLARGGREPLESACESSRVAQITVPYLEGAR